MRKVDAALALARRGFLVFPITPGKKAPPLVGDWPTKATVDAEVIGALWGKWPEANIGIHCKGLVVLDVDTKSKGDDSLAKLRMLEDVPDTLTSKTPSGGLHLIYRLPPDHPGVPNTVGKDAESVLGRGIDVRSTNGYIVAPTSTVEKGAYKFQADTPIADAPEWLVQKLGVFTKRERKENVNVPDAPEDTLARAEAWLRTAPRSVKGAGGDQTAYQVACRLRDFGVSEQQAIELMRSEAWDHGCGWRDGRLEEKPIHSAFRYAQNEPGNLAVSADDFPEPEATAPMQVPEEKPVKSAAPRTVAQLALAKANGPGYLVKGLLNKASYVDLYGPSGAGKTFLSLDLAYHVAAGDRWLDHPVRQGVCLYLAYEGAGGLLRRSQALMKRYKKDVPLFIDNASYNLREPSGLQALACMIETLPAKPVLIVIDTFAQALMGGDENSAQDVGTFNRSVQALIGKYKCCVMIIHHTGKDTSKGARGSSALRAAVETELEVGDHQVYVCKQREMELEDSIGFKLVPIAVDMDEDADIITSCYVEHDPFARTRVDNELKGNPKKAFDALVEARPDNAPLSMARWKAACLEGGMTAKRFSDAKKSLLEKNLIELDADDNVTRRID